VLKSTDRLGSVEWVRVTAAFGLVWFHTSAAVWREIGYAGLPIFLMLSIGLTAGKMHEEPCRAFLARRARRLLIPWFFWSAVYLCYQLGRQYLKGTGDLHLYGVATVLVGSSLHLWYLPFAFLADIPAYAVGRRPDGRGVARRSLLVGGAGVAAMGVCSYAMSVRGLLGIPFAQWVFAIPAVLLGLAVGPLAHEGAERWPRGMLIGLGVAVLIVCAVLHAAGLKALTVPYAISVPLVIGAFLLRARAGAWAIAAGSLTYGIYILHPLIGGVLTFAGLKDSPWLLRVVVVFLVSAGVTAVLKMTPVRRFL